MTKGRRVVAVGGSDAHARHRSLGPLHKTIFPYEYHFSTINTHMLTPTPLTGELAQDRKMVFDALAAGHCFIGYDLPAPTRGFRFSAQSRELTASWGRNTLHGAVTLQANFLPSRDQIDQGWKMHQVIARRYIYYIKTRQVFIVLRPTGITSGNAAAGFSATQFI